MHFEVLVEDQSGKKMLEIIIPKIVGNEHTFRVLDYKGLGEIPKNMKDPKEVTNRILLQNLPRLLKAYGKTFSHYPENNPAAVVLVCDLDQKCLKRFRQELHAILNSCHPKPNTGICIAIEEGEAWLLGDLNAIKSAYPKAKDTVLRSYCNDSICGTWEKLADAIHPEGSTALAKQGWQAVGKEKSTWAEKISPLMNVNDNLSPSFQYFRDKLLVFCDLTQESDG